MPYSMTKLPDAVKNKTEKAKRAFLSAYDSAIDRGLSEDDSLFSALTAATNAEKSVNKATTLSKPIKPALPSHLAAVLQKRAVEPSSSLPEATPRIKQEFLGKNALTADPERSLVSASWDANARLQLQFDDGAKIVTDPVPVSENIEQHVSISTDLSNFGVDQLQDVEITAVQNGHILKYDSATSTWKNVNPAAASGVTTGSFFQKVNLVANTPLTISHNLALIDKDAFTINTVLAGKVVSINCSSVDANSLQLTSAIAANQVSVTIIGVIA